LFLKALKAIDVVGHQTNVRYSQVHKHRTFEEAKKIDLEKTIRQNQNDEINEEKKI
jgi:hypothetical protein